MKSYRTGAVVLVAGVAVLAGCGGAGQDQPTSGPTNTAYQTTAPTNSKPPTTYQPSTAPSTAGLKVTRVVDGDTVRLSDGSTVRLAGIDTPERGQCGYKEATDLLRKLADGKPVTLVQAGPRNDRDRYGRFVRYVHVGKTDVGLAQLEAGVAVHRYDGLGDNYPTHPRRDAYVAADKAHPNPYCKLPNKTANPAPTH